MILTHSGTRIDCEKAPISGAILALNAAAGASSKSRAWSWVADAKASLAILDPEKAEEMERIANDTTNNFPNSGAALRFVEGIIATI